MRRLRRRSYSTRLQLTWALRGQKIMVIRLAKPAELEAVIQVDPIAERGRTRRSFLEYSILRGECWLADLSGEILGFVVLEHSFYGNGFVPVVVVRLFARRRGIGLRFAVARRFGVHDACAHCDG
jgi:hypothetical protein